jgi:cell wall-associated NlpC family hydrolase
MAKFDDAEILDFDDESEDNIEQEETSESVETPQNNFQRPNFLRENNDSTTSNKLKSLGSQNRSFPILGASNFHNEDSKNQNEEVENSNEKESSSSLKKIDSKLPNVLSKQDSKSETGNRIAELYGKLPSGLKVKIIISVAVLVAVLLLIMIPVFINVSSDEEVGQNTYTYVTGDMNEEELVDELKYYGYCDDQASCESKGIYKFLNEIKEYYEEYQKNCPSNITNDNPCEVTINPALIIETVNYYQNVSTAFDTYEDEESKNADQEEGFNIFNFFSSIVNKYKKQKAISDMLNDVEALAMAQTEYVQESCQYLSEYEKQQDLKDGKVDNKTDQHTIYYYQISYNKYVSYLKYGTTSNHPNYSGQPYVKETKEICEYAVNDNFTGFDTSDTNDSTTDNSTTNSTGTLGLGVEIATYAQQFNGNPYVWGGESLTNGVDCSGFTMKVMEKFGISLPHNAASQFSMKESLGTDISNALPGDLIFYSNGSTINHVAIYLGNGLIIHASSPTTGIKISNATYRSIAGIVRFWG